MAGRSPKPIVFLGDSLDQLRAFPEGARRQAGVQLHKVQLGFEPSDWKPMRTVGTGAVEIRIRDDRGAFRVIYFARRDDAVYVLHAFQKKTERTPKRELDLATLRLKQIGGRMMERQAFANVWDALEDTQADAVSMTMRSKLLIAIEQQVRSWNVSQANAARRLGVTQPRLNDLLRGRIQNFSLDALVDLAARAGLSVRLDIAA
jgi:phage-related protein/predicted XRE-type DNA-binding protein